MINWTAEDIEFISNYIVMPIAKEIIETNDKIDKAHEDSYGRLFDSIIDKLHEISYNRCRDVKFFLDFIAQQQHLDRDSVYNVYKAYCERYDKLHKEKNDD